MSACSGPTKGKIAMNIWVLLLLLFIFGAFGGGYAGWYSHSYGFGGGGLLILILVILLITGRL
jgi:hypothetical protein